MTFEDVLNFVSKKDIPFKVMGTVVNRVVEGTQLLHEAVKIMAVSAGASGSLQQFCSIASSTKDLQDARTLIDERRKFGPLAVGIAHAAFTVYMDAWLGIEKKRKSL